MRKLTWRWYLAVAACFLSCFLQPAPGTPPSEVVLPTLRWAAAMLIALGLGAWEAYLMGRPWFSKPGGRS